MKRFGISFLSIYFLFAAQAQTKLNVANVDSIISVMTLEEKATLLVGGAKAVVIDGIPTGVATRVPGAAGTTRPIERLGIPGTVLADGPAGVRIDPKRKGTDSTFYATCFPTGTLMASSWDTELMEEVAKAMGNEVLEYGVDVLLAPGMNIHRNPLNGRNFEYYSEDPVLSGKMAAAFVRGIQSNGVGTSMKHFAANNQETNRLANDSRVGERALREIYLKNFEIALKESKPWTIMASYNMLNGDYTQQKKDLLTHLLREEWEYDGMVMTDWGFYDGTVKAVKAGNDLMEPGFQEEIERIVNAVKSLDLSIEDVDRNVKHVLEYILKSPSFRNYAFTNNPDLQAHARIARKGAAESMVLLKNEELTLPLNPGLKVALYGISSLDFIPGGRGAAHVNKPYVVNMKEALQNAGFAVDSTLMNFYRLNLELKEAEGALTNTNIHYWLGDMNSPEIEIPEKAIELESKCNDVAIIIIGRNAGEGSDRVIENDFELNQTERNLLAKVNKAFHAQGKKVIVILNVSGVIETNSWRHFADAILLPWTPGQEGANAIVEVLTGKVNPSGKLPMTFPISVMDHPSSKNFPVAYNSESSIINTRKGNALRPNVDYTDYQEGIWVGYRFFNTADEEVSYPFGFGLSYTNFSYSNPTVKVIKDGIEASVKITNTGEREGKEVVQLYISAPQTNMKKPRRELKGFAKTRELKPGESQILKFKISNYELASYDDKNTEWVAASGKYDICFGANVEDIRACGKYILEKNQYWKTQKLLHLEETIIEIDCP